MQTLNLKSISAFLCSVTLCVGPLSAQSPSSAKTIQMETDWEKIRDAQVQMIKKKEADLDRMKEELLARAQPQAQMQTGFPEIEAEMKKREAEWLEKSDRYENENTMLKVKMDEQKKEIHSLRVKLDLILKQNPSLPVEAPTSERPVVSDASQKEVSEIETRSEQLKLKEKQFQSEKQNLEKERAAWQAGQSQFEQKRKAELIQLETDQRALEVQKKAIESERATIMAERKNLAEKAKGLEVADKREQDLARAGDDLALRKKDLESKQLEFLEREKRISESQKNLVEEKRLWSIQKSNQDATLGQKLTDLESKLTLAQDSKQSATLELKSLESQIAALKKQTQVDKDAVAERELNWKKREGSLLKKQAGIDTQMSLLRAGLDESTMKLKNVQSQVAQLEAQLFHAEEKLSQSQQKQAELLAQNAVQVAVPSDAQLKVKLEQSQAENKKWQGMKQELENHWSTFVNKEMEFQMEIEDLKKKNQALQNQIASAFSVSGNTKNQPSWSQRQQSLD